MFVVFFAGERARAKILKVRTSMAWVGFYDACVQSLLTIIQWACSDYHLGKSCKLDIQNS